MFKRLIAAVILIVTGLDASAQGTVLFRCFSGTSSVLIYDSDGLTPLAGTQFQAELLYGPVADQLVVLPPSTPFRTGAFAGTFNGGARVLPGIPEGGTAWVQIRIWDTATGATYDDAAASGSTRHSASPVFSVVTGMPSANPPGLPSMLTGWQPQALSFISPPIIQSATPDQTNNLGDTANFSVQVTGTYPLYYQWRKNGSDIADGGNIFGATNSNLSLVNLGYDDAGSFSVVVSNAYGCVTSTPAASLTVIDALSPVLAITSHANLQLVSPSVLTLGGTASDAGRGDNGIASVTVNGVRATNDTASAADTAYWSRTLNLTVGTNTFTVIARDGLGNAATSIIRVVTDSSRPTIVITSPTLNQRWSNSVFTVRGRATDDKAVAGIWYQLNQNDWALADGTTNWAATVQLTPGTNTVRAFTADSAGNASPTNSVNFVYVLTAPIIVQTNGRGTLSPNYNDAALELGRNYTMTATASPGFAFTNWTGSLTTNKPALTFLMASNLTLTANFVDVQKPTLTLVSPAPFQRWSNENFTITGRATDNVGVIGIWYQFNQNDWSLADGTTNWSAAVQLTPGTNTLKVCAIDDAGNRSATNSLSFVYVLTAPITVQTNGRGTLSPNYNGAALELGRNYTMTATASSGFAFTNWTGSLATNKPALTFLMASNLTLTANFVDVQKPTLTLVSPTPFQRWSNDVFTITGRATDNVGIAGIWYQFNASDWTLADGTTNWSTAVQLTPGTNTLKVFSADDAGNRSATNSLSFVYVLTVPITVQTNGRGSLSPNYNGAALEIGRNYTMTATASPGFAFTNWTGSLATNKPALTFLMASNLTLTANFVDVQKPMLTLVSPTPFQRWSNENFTITGRATDNVGVAGIWYQFNASDWTLADGTTNWSAAVQLTPGTNTLKVFAADATGNRSTTNTASFVFVVTSPLTLVTNGIGRINYTFTSPLLEVGRAYTVTAVPGAGQLFSNWTGGLVLTNNPLTFIMQSNLVLEANFVTNPFIATKGVYNGLFYETNGVQNYSAGSVTLTLSDNGAYTANVKVGGGSYPLVGQFDVAGRSSKTVARPGTNALQVVLALDLTPDANRLTGAIGNGSWTAELTADRAIFTALNPATNQAGKYTLIIPGTPTDPTLPAGHGFGALTMDSAGRITFSGSLADGTAISQSATLSKDGYWPLYVSLYGGKGCVLAWLSITNQPGDDLEGSLSWIQPPQTIAKTQLPGFNFESFAVGSRYVTPAVTNRVLQFTNGLADFAGGNLAAAFTNNIAFNANNLVANTSSNLLTLTLTPASGLFTGSVLEPASGRTWQFKGAFLQKQNGGFGYLTGTNQSSSVVIEPR